MQVSSYKPQAARKNDIEREVKGKARLYTDPAKRKRMDKNPCVQKKIILYNYFLL